MNAETIHLAGKLIAANYASHASQALSRVESLVQSLLSQRRIPDEGWSDSQVEHFVQSLAQMDSNNYVGNCGVGEREGRVWSHLVRQRYYHLSHGIGRSGDITANQPKAAGSSLLYALTNILALDALRLSGAKAAKQAVVLPSATGMALTLVLQHLKGLPPPSATADSVDQGDTSLANVEHGSQKYVIWSRIDQKTCLKCISSAGLEPVVVPLLRDGRTLRTDTSAIEAEIQRRGPGAVCCVLTTTSCFAPRGPDDVLAVARLCQRYGVRHVINNAYGVQSPAIMKAVNSAMEHGRVDFFVQSTDKNFMVPVGGSIVASSSADSVQQLAASYPGRASASPILDLFITLLSMGRRTYQRLLDERKDLLRYFHQKLVEFAARHQESTLIDQRNDISFALSLDRLPPAAVTGLGSSLFYKGVSGPRSVPRGVVKNVCGIVFQGYGAHCDDFPHHYLAMACAIGLQQRDIDMFFRRLEKSYTEQMRQKTTMTQGMQDLQGPPAPHTSPGPAGPYKVVTEGSCVLEFWDVCSSTMTEAAALTQRRPDADFAAVCSRRQLSGRGTGERRWLSPEGNVYMTIAVRKAKLIHAREFLLPLETALVTLQSIQSVAQLTASVGLKWPNDVVVGGRKVSGCLIEEAGDFRLVGIGINVEVAPEVTDGGRPSGCLCDYGMARGGAEYLAHTLVRTFQARMLAHQNGTRQALIEEWKQHAAWDLLLHTRDARRKLVRAEDLTEYGQLLVRGVDDGVPETLTADYLD